MKSKVFKAVINVDGESFYVDINVDVLGAGETPAIFLSGSGSIRADASMGENEIYGYMRESEFGHAYAEESMH